MLENVLRVHDIDILFAQEVTSPETTNIGGYETHHNIGSSMRGTAILAKEGITLTNVTKLPSGRAIAAEYRGTLLINIYMLHPALQKGTNVSTFLTMNYHIY
jgi:exonuclease III